MRYLVIIVGAVLVNNFVLNRFLGRCPFLGVSTKTETALGMSSGIAGFQRRNVIGISFSMVK